MCPSSRQSTALLMALSICISLHAGGIDALRCWVCGQDASPQNTNQDTKTRQLAAQREDGLRTGASSIKGAWCSTSIVSVPCQPAYNGQEMLCYKELWSVDGNEMVKRGCALKDKRYNRTGCEEQITGDGSFNLVLCLCQGSLCNGAGTVCGSPGASAAAAGAAVAVWAWSKNRRAQG